MTSCKGILGGVMNNWVASVGVWNVTYLRAESYWISSKPPQSQVRWFQTEGNTHSVSNRDCLFVPCCQLHAEHYPVGVATLSSGCPLLRLLQGSNWRLLSQFQSQLCQIYMKWRRSKYFTKRVLCSHHLCGATCYLFFNLTLWDLFRCSLEVQLHSSKWVNVAAGIAIWWY